MGLDRMRLLSDFQTFNHKIVAMKTWVKILLTILVTIIFPLIGSVLGNLPRSPGKGILCLLCVAAWGFSYFGIWKKRKQS